jgi:hypothetical protein
MKILHLILPIVALATNSHAAIVASGLQNITITSDFTGLYLDIDGGGAVAEEALGWDLNAFFGGEGIGNSPSFHPVAATVSLDAPILNLAFGQTVNASSIFASTYPGGFSSSDTHVGNGAGQFISGDEGYIGFQFTANNNAGPFYGWMRVELSNTGDTGLIREWAYENSGAAITVGAVPEPSTLCALLLGTAGFCYRRRR